MTFEPYVGIGPIKFGMTVQQVREVLQSPATPFMKTPDSLHPTDAFERLWIHVYYDRSGICEYVEFTSPSRIVFQGRDLLSIPYGELRAWCMAEDPLFEEDNTGCGFASHGMGFSVYTSLTEEEPERPAEAIGVFRRSYYDE